MGRLGKVLAVICLAAMLVTCGVLYAQAADTIISVGESVPAAEEGQLLLPVRIEGNPGFLSFSLEILYDESQLTLLGVEVGDGLCNDPAELIALTAQNRLLWGMSGSDTLVSGNGVLCYLKFSVNAAASGTTDVGLKLYQDNLNNFKNSANENIAVDFAAITVQATGSGGGGGNGGNGNGESYTVSLAAANPVLNVGESIAVEVRITGETAFTNLDVYVDFDASLLSFTRAESSLPQARGECLTPGQVYLNAYGAANQISEGGFLAATLYFTALTPATTGRHQTSVAVNANSSVGAGTSSEDAPQAAIGPQLAVTLYNLAVRFEAATGSILTPVTAYVRYNQAGLFTAPGYAAAFTIPTPQAADGYLLMEPLTWSDGQSTYTNAQLASATFSADTALHALTASRWEVRFYVDAVQVGSTQSVNNGASAVAPADPAAPTGKTFAGWYVAHSASEPYQGQELQSKAELDVTPVIADIIYCAYFRSNTYSFTYDSAQFTIVSGLDGDGKANYGTDLVFTVNAAAQTPGYQVVVSYQLAGGAWQDLTPQDGRYTIAGELILADINLSMTEQLAGSITFISHDDYHAAPLGYKLLKLQISGQQTAGYCYRYDGQMMYWSEKYGAYAYFVPESVDEAQALTKITLVAGVQEAIAYDGDVNRSGRVNSQDSQIIYMLFTGQGEGQTDYLNDTGFSRLSMRSRLEADVNGNGIVDSIDARAVQGILFGDPRP